MAPVGETGSGKQAATPCFEYDVLDPSAPPSRPRAMAARETYGGEQRRLDRLPSLAQRSAPMTQTTFHPHGTSSDFDRNP